MSHRMARQAPGPGDVCVWRQGSINPEDQHASEDCGLAPEHLAQKRLRPNGVIRAVYRKCNQCAAFAPFSLECTTDGNGLWHETKIVAKMAQSRTLEDGWIQCMNCSNAWPGVEGNDVYSCPACKRIIQVSLGVGVRSSPL